MRPLTPKQLKFAHYVACGLSATEAYRRAYSAVGKKGTQRKEAHGVIHSPAVSAYIARLKKEAAERARMTREETLAKLEEIICDPDISAGHRVAAVRVRNEMTGDNAPVAVNVFGLSDLLALIRKKQHSKP